MAELAFLIVGCIVVWPFVNGPARPASEQEKAAAAQLDAWADEREEWRRAVRRYWW